MSMTTTIRMALCAGTLLATAGCITPDGYSRPLDGGGSGQGGAGTGGVSGSGGATGTGGVTGTAGSPVPGTGGSPVTATGGATGKGGAVGTGGTTGTGGAAATGGTTGAGGASGTLFSDSFESGAGKWLTSGPGTATIASDGSSVYDLSCLTSKVFLAAAGDVTWTNVVVQARIKVLSFNGSSSSYYAGLCARVEDADNYYCVTLRSDAKVAIRGDIGGSSNSLGSSVSYGVTAGTWYTVRLQVVGSTITASINGTPVLPKTGDPAITDASLATGGIALIVDNADAEFDDVTVSVP
jgi:pectate lyase